MGKPGSGRPRKPQALRDLQGSRKRPAHKVEPRVDPGVPEAPDHLTSAERALWDYYAPLLDTVKVLSRQDRDTLVQFCEARAQVEDIKRQQAAPEYRRVVLSVTVDSAGNEKVKGETHPLDIQRRQWTQIARLCAAELGLSPTSRGRAQVAGEGEGEGEGDPLAEFAGIRRVK